MSSKTTTKTHFFHTGDPVWVKDHTQRQAKWKKGKITKQISSVVYLVQLKEYDSHVKKLVDQ